MRIGRTWPLVILLTVSAAVRLPGLVSRAIWYDESITLLETAGNANPTWPQEPAPAELAKKQFKGTPSLSEIAGDLYRTDVHPPVYFWLLSFWRRWLGYSIETARVFSLVCSIGAVLMLYLLLQIGQIEHPIIPSLSFAVSSGAVFAGQEARAYALTSLLVVAAAFFAYLAYGANDDRAHFIIYSISMALCSGIAFLANYLAIFPVLVILLWFLINVWSASRLRAMLAPMAALSICLMGIPALLAQLGARPDQKSGFIGIFPEVVALTKSTASVIWSGTGQELRLIFAVLLLLLIGTSTIYVVHHWSETNRKLCLLFVGLACAPAAGIFLLDMLSGKHLADTQQYFLFAGPAFAVILTYGITTHPITKSLLIILIGLQLVVLNWGLESSPGWPGSNLRSLANTIKDDSSQSHIVVIGAGFGRGHVGSVIYELDPEAVIVVLDNNGDLEKLQSSIQSYDDIWIVPSVDNATASVENELLSCLQESGLHANMSRRQSAIHLWR